MQAGTAGSARGSRLRWSSVLGPGDDGPQELPLLGARFTSVSAAPGVDDRAPSRPQPRHFIDGLAPAADELTVTKQYPSAFFGTALAAYLTANRVDTLFIGGLTTSGCVRATALDAMQHGFVPVVAEEAVGDRDPDVHAANLFDIRHKIGEVWPPERATAYLGGAGWV